MQAEALVRPEEPWMPYKIQTVQVAASGMTRDLIPNQVVDRYTQAMGPDTEGVIGYGADGRAALLDRLSPRVRKVALDSPRFAASFAQHMGGEIMVRAKRVSVVPPKDRLLHFGIQQARMDRFMQDDHPAPAVSWYDGVGLFAWLSEKTGRDWGFPDELEHQVAGLAGRNPRTTFYPTRSGTIEKLPYEAHYGQALDTGVTQPNGIFPATPWGYRDMAGQLWQWMQQIHPVNNYRIVRGGSWLHYPNDLPPCAECADYRYYNPIVRGPNIGLRGRVGA